MPCPLTGALQTQHDANSNDVPKSTCRITHKPCMS